MQSFALAVAVGASLVAAQQPASSGASAFMSSAAPSAAMNTGAPLPTAVSPEQMSKIEADFSSYNAQLMSNAYVNSLGSAIKSWLPRGSWDNFNGAGFHSQLTISTDYLALATATPTYVYPSWVTGLPGSLQSDWGAFATSVQLAHESIVRSDLSIADRTDVLPGPSAGVVQGPTPSSNSITSNTNAAAKATVGPAIAVGLAGLAAMAL